ncbi:MAG: hypothetical protein ACK4LB_05855 [Spirosomataceae bacterium]
MTRSLAQFVSVVFHPLFMPSALFAILLYGAPEVLGLENIQGKTMLMGFIFVYTTVFPALLIGWMARQGLIQSIQLKQLKDRGLPYVSTALLYAFFAVFIGYQTRLMWYAAWMLGGTATVIACLGIISLKWQISAHAAGIGGVIGVLGWINLLIDHPLIWIIWLISLPIAGLVMSARLSLNAHTPAQVWAGGFLGLVVQTIFVAWVMPSPLG